MFVYFVFFILDDEIDLVVDVFFFNKMYVLLILDDGCLIGIVMIYDLLCYVFIEMRIGVYFG